MAHDLKDTTFIIPIRIESDDRLRNVITVLCYLLEEYDTQVIVKEVDETSRFREEALPQIFEYVGPRLEQLRYFWEDKDPDDDVFYRMRYINEMLSKVETPVVANYDCDVLMEPKAYLQAQSAIVEGGYDVIYPFGQGVWQKKVTASDELVSEFLSNDCDFNILDRNIEMDNAESGHVQFFKTSAYREGGMENENFRGSSPEDKERIHRFNTLGYNVGRIENYIYHLEHSRGNNSWPNSFHGNPHMQENFALYEFLIQLSPEELRAYYNEQKYLKKYT